MNAPLDELIDAIGIEATLTLVERFGGVRIYVPEAGTLTEDHPIVRAIGLEAAQRLARMWPQERPYLPRAVAELRRRRDEALVADLDAGMSFSQAARKYRLTERQVYSIKAAAPARAEIKQRQAGLF